MKLAGAYINDATYERLVALATSNNRTLAGQCRHLFDRALKGELAVPHSAAKETLPPSEIEHVEPMNGMQRIEGERKRQIEVEGWDPLDDDRYTNLELKFAADCYARGDTKTWPWDVQWWKPTTKIRNLEKAGALYLAEAARCERLGTHLLPGGLTGTEGAKLMHFRAKEIAMRINQALAVERKKGAA